MKKKSVILLTLTLLLFLTACSMEENKVPIAGEFENGKIISKKLSTRGGSQMIQLDIEGNVVNLYASNSVYGLVQEGTKIDGTYNEEMRLVDVWISGTKKITGTKKEE